MKKKIVLAAALLSLVWTFYLMVAVALNHLSVAPRVAGGHLHSFSGPLRFTYGVEALMMIFQFFFLIKIFQRNGVWSSTTSLLARIFLVLSTMSTVVNAVSRSSAERWNAIAALAIAYAFYELADLRIRPRRK